ncbi:MAG: hypothetical protein ABIP75_18500 [Pyrinomonadaceae bacterium]
MKTICLLAILFALFPVALGRPDKKFELSLTLIRGERSKDTHSTTQMVRISGDQATFDLTYHGRRGPNQKPVQRTVTLTKADLKSIEKLLGQHTWFPDESCEFVRAGAMTYFSIGIGVGSGEKASNILLTGTPGHPEIKANKKYQYANLLVTEIFRILHEHDSDIEFSAVVN